MTTRPMNDLEKLISENIGQCSDEELNRLAELGSQQFGKRKKGRRSWNQGCNENIRFSIPLHQNSPNTPWIIEFKLQDAATGRTVIATIKHCWHHRETDYKPGDEADLQGNPLLKRFYAKNYIYRKGPRVWYWEGGKFLCDDYVMETRNSVNSYDINTGEPMEEMFRRELEKDSDRKSHFCGGVEYSEHFADAF